MKNIAQSVPEFLIYEMVDEKPIYYKGYKDYLAGHKQLDEIMGSSFIQSLIITRLVYLLMSKLDKQYQVLTSEVGLQLEKKKTRAADIAIFETIKLKEVKEPNKYLAVNPKIVIEVDIKADMEEVQDSLSYFHKKTDELLKNGIEKVIWIFTDSQKVMVSRKNEAWQIVDWSKDIEVMDDIVFNIAKMIEDVSS